MSAVVHEFLSDGEEDGNHPQKKGWRRFWGRSLQELIVICLPAMCIPTVSAIAACFLYDPGMKVLVFSVLPEKHKNWLSFGVCWLEELRMLFMIVGIAVPVFQVQVITFDVLNYSLEAIGKDLIR